MNITKVDVETAVWLAEYVGLNGNGFQRDEELNVARMAVNLADAYCSLNQVQGHPQVWLDGLHLLEQACSIAWKVGQRDAERSG